MQGDAKLSAFARYSLVTLLYNFAVILWGVFLRASRSGDGCGEHWLTCNGEVVPSAPQLKTIIEFSHRISTAIAGFIVLGLVIWTFRGFGKGNPIRKTTAWTALFILLEVGIGAVIVLTGSTAENWTAGRPFIMAAHLLITFGLLASLTLGFWFASGRPNFGFKVERKYLVAIAGLIIGLLIVGISGSIAALSNLLYAPAGTIAEGIRQDISSESPALIQLRGFHPLMSVTFGIILILSVGWFKKEASGNAAVQRLASLISILVLVQFASGLLTIFMHAPIVMQLLHLFLADVIWISFVLLTASFLSKTSRN